MFSYLFQGESEVDVIAEQLKFRACLKILMTELRTLATGFEVDGGKLRFQLYSWLEKEIAAMHTICNYKVHFVLFCFSLNILSCWSTMLLQHTFCEHKGGRERGGVRGGALGRAFIISGHIRRRPGAYRGRGLRASPDGAPSSSGQAAAL